MKRRIRFLSALLLFCLLFSLVCLLSGCGSDSSSGSSKGEGKAPGDSGVHIAEDSPKGGDILSEEKIIRTARLTLETTAYDTALPALKQSVVKAGGYLESRTHRTDSGSQSGHISCRRTERSGKNPAFGDFAE